MVPLGHLADALHSGHGSLVILGEVQADAVRELGTKLGAGGDGDGGLSPAQLNELVQGDLQSGELEEDVAAALGGTGPAAGVLGDNLQQIVPDGLVVGYPLR